MPGFLDAPATWQELYNTTEWTSRDSMVKLFPEYVQEQYQHKKENRKNETAFVKTGGIIIKGPQKGRVITPKLVSMNDSPYSI